MGMWCQGLSTGHEGVLCSAQVSGSLHTVPKFPECDRDETDLTAIPMQGHVFCRAC